MGLFILILKKYDLKKMSFKFLIFKNITVDIFSIVFICFLSCILYYHSRSFMKTEHHLALVLHDFFLLFYFPIYIAFLRLSLSLFYLLFLFILFASIWWNLLWFFFCRLFNIGNRHLTWTMCESILHRILIKKKNYKNYKKYVRVSTENFRLWMRQKLVCAHKVNRVLVYTVAAATFCQHLPHHHRFSQESISLNE